MKLSFLFVALFWSVILHAQMGMLCSDTNITSVRDLRSAGYLTAPFVIPRKERVSEIFKISPKVRCQAYASDANEVYNITAEFPLYIKDVVAYEDGLNGHAEGHIQFEVHSDNGLIDTVSCDVRGGVPSSYTLGNLQEDFAGEYLNIDWSQVYNPDCNTMKVEK